MSWDVAVEMLVDAKEMEDASIVVGCGSTAFALPEQCVEIVGIAKTVRSRMSNDWARASRCNNPPASSRSEFEIVPLGLSEVTSLSLMYFGHSRCHTSALF